LPVSFFISAILISAAFVYSVGLKAEQKNREISNNPNNGVNHSRQAGVSEAFNAREAVAPPQGTELPVKWGDLGKKMVGWSY